MLLRVNGQANEGIQQEPSLVSRECKKGCPVGCQIQLWLCIHVLKSSEDFSASGSLRFQNVIPIPTLEVKPTISCKTTSMLCRINSKINELNGLRTILLMKTKRIFLFISRLQGIYIVMHVSFLRHQFTGLFSYVFVSLLPSSYRYGHSSWILVFVTNFWFLFSLDFQYSSIFNHRCCKQVSILDICPRKMLE